MEQLALAWGPSRKTYTVAELNARIRAILESDFDDIWVAGEISGCKIAASGHCYFTLKDHEAQLRCVCFRSSLRYLKFKPQDGVAVLARGHLDLFEARGEYQLLVEALEPQGHGALQFAFEQLKKKLAAEGLFEAARKRPIPRLPQRIGIVSSPTGAVISDMTQILSRRFPGLHIRLFPALMQGEGSIETVCRAIEYFSNSRWADVVIVHAIAACAVPVISAIGHETDFTIADFVADLRAPTPSAAAELVICTRDQLLEQIGVSEHKLLQSVRYRLAMATRRLHQQGVERATAILHRSVGRRQQRVDELEYQMYRHLSARKNRLEERTSRLRSLDLRLRFAHTRRRLEAAQVAIVQLARLKLTRGYGRLNPLIAHLTQLSPLKILERGYAIVTNEAGAIVKEPPEAPVDSRVDIRLARGAITAKVTND
jgi:exodeoxyribonuclease VII large subunit